MPNPNKSDVKRDVYRIVAAAARRRISDLKQNMKLGGGSPDEAVGLDNLALEGLRQMLNGYIKIKREEDNNISLGEFSGDTKMSEIVELVYNKITQ